MSSQSTPRVRIAPSPTGDPHVGTAYIGLINFLYARQGGGQFVLRIEDTDRTRFVPTSEQMIFDALHWLGLTWDEGPDVGGPYGPYRQSERTEIYREHAEILLNNGTAYRCFCTAEELEASRKAQMAAKQPPKYAGTCRHLTPEQIAANIAESKPFTIRMLVPEGSTTFRDELRGDIVIDHANVDDQVLMKSDGFPTYHLANVVDDHLMKITDVIRAEEWISSTPKHVLLYASFGWERPKFWHMPLLRNQDKSKISKRKNPVSLVYYRQAGFVPEAVINFLGLLGGGMPQEVVGVSEKFSLAEMLEKFSVPNISLGGPVFDLTKLKWLNSEYLRAMSLDDFYTALRATVLSDEYLKGVAELVQTRIETLGQFGDLTNFFFADNILPAQEVFLPKKKTLEETLAFAAEQLTVLEAADWTKEALEGALKALGEAHSWSVKENFMLLRAIVTGSTMSPPLLESMIVFGKARTLDRMRRFLDAQKKLALQKK
ncbi:glutamate--tRNA ligase [Silvibacterium dinghuense]|uniref:Glutamate--tRNA ligase n=1 Tax=Silvibacterium dinghuense TaxID=1560006 RepID=A0A4Q1SI45_9BACT|nr:glutamate--tRNA ligase [Silvibacterium dinghuense]RXS97278.1 glutamate--tRNA ligase [Silvibacterium dinghuense]GGG97739.1 glutamate--tRNA ligase [Silvibacterium dinghuense]